MLPILPDIEYHITGFGPFSTITENPTTRLIQKFQEYKENLEKKLIKANFQLGDLSVLKVTTEDCQEYISKIHKIIAEEKKIHPDKIQIIIHLGVNASAQNINLELFSYNGILLYFKYYKNIKIIEATFRIPDNNLVKLNRQKVFKDHALSHFFKSTLPLEYIPHRIPEHLQPHVELSKDPGRYICNYIYLLAIPLVMKASKMVPTFETKQEELQFEILVKILETFTDLIQKENP